jgi:hypothetical protein
MKDLQREILSQVASGAISAEEGAARLEALESTPPPTAEQRVPAQAAPAAASTKRVRVTSRFGNTEIIGDASVVSVLAEGPHKARQEGDTMVIEQTLLNDETAFEFVRAQGRVRIPGVDLDRRLTIRMNPALALSATVQAGSLHIRGLEGAVRGDVQAGNCLIDDFRGPIDLNVTAGDVAATGRLDGGASRIQCRMGEARVVLDRRSNVRITARSTMGDVTFAGVDDIRSNELMLGTGAGSLDCDCLMGSVRIVVE